MNEAGRAMVWVLAFVAAAAAGFAALVGIGCAIGANACPFGDARAATTKDPQVLFQQNCALCHGENGEGTERNANAPSLRSGKVAAMTEAEILDAIESGSPGLMPRFEGKLSDEQIAVLTKYVQGLREAS